MVNQWDWIEELQLDSELDMLDVYYGEMLIVVEDLYALEEIDYDVTNIVYFAMENNYEKRTFDYY